MTANFCEFYFNKIVKDTSICDLYPVLHTGFVSIVTNGLTDYKNNLKLMDNPNIDKIHTMSANMLYYLRQGIIVLLDRGMKERKSFVKQAIAFQQRFIEVLFFTIFVISSVGVYYSIAYLTNQVPETVFFATS